jgi:hypothetical protein
MLSLEVAARKNIPVGEVYDMITSLPPSRGGVNRGAMALDSQCRYNARLANARRRVREVLGRDLTPEHIEIIKYTPPEEVMVG